MKSLLKDRILQIHYLDLIRHFTNRIEEIEYKFEYIANNLFDELKIKNPNSLVDIFVKWKEEPIDESHVEIQGCHIRSLEHNLNLDIPFLKNKHLILFHERCLQGKKTPKFGSKTQYSIEFYLKFSGYYHLILQETLVKDRSQDNKEMTK